MLAAEKSGAEKGQSKEANLMSARFTKILLITVCAVLILGLSETAEAVFTMQVVVNNNTDQGWQVQECVTGQNAGFECVGPDALDRGTTYTYIYIPQSGSFELIERFYGGSAGRVICAQHFSSSYTVGATVNLNQEGTGYSCSISITQ
jgi:hypothetical protein